jgi:hypothetical protein
MEIVERTHSYRHSLPLMFIPTPTLFSSSFMLPLSLNIFHTHSFGMEIVERTHSVEELKRRWAKFNALQEQRALEAKLAHSVSVSLYFLCLQCV